MDLKNLSVEELVALQNEKRAAFDALVALDAPTDEQLAEAESLRDDIRAIEAEQEARETAATERAERLAGLRSEFSDTEGADDEEDEEDDDEEDDSEVEASADDDEEEETEVEAAAKKPAPKKTAARLAARTKRPPKPQSAADLITITAAADSGFSAGSHITLDDLGTAAINRLKGQAVPNGTGEVEDLRHFPIGNMAMQFSDDLKITRATSEEDAFAILLHAGDEKRLAGGSLLSQESITAAAGWCAPSETIYDLCSNEKVDGIWDLPEVQVSRGGVKHPTSTDFSSVFSAVGLIQTEAQAIAGTAKTCYEVPCPTFVDDRLDAVYSCIKVPLLLQAGYPEQVRDIMNKTVIAQQYKVNASVATRMVAYAGAARDFTADLGSTTVALLSGLDLVLEDLRQQWRLGKDATLEVVLPVWARSAIRNDLGARNGRPPEAVSDAEIMAHFAVRKTRVQFVYGWQELPADPVVWPANVEFMAYPAGSFVKGRSDVINLSAVYDAASLATNLYTALFQEEGLLVAKMCQEAVRGTIPTNQAGRTGAANLT